MKYQADKIELFRCKKGYLESNQLKIPFLFGIVFESSGLLTFEISIDESFDVVSMARDENDRYFNMSFTGHCLSDRNDSLEIRKLHFNNLDTAVSTATLTCYDCIIQTKNKDNRYTQNIKLDKEPSIYYIELEGLKMEFSHHTELTVTREGVEIWDPNNLKLDHTSASLIFQGIEYNQLLYSSQNKENIIVDFLNQNSKKQWLPFKLYKELKLEYTYALSLLNGAEVRVRREYTGDFYSGGKADSHVVIQYSFATVSNKRYNYYIPLNDPFKRGTNIIDKFFSSNFDKYVMWNKRIDLYSVMFYFISSIQAQSMAEVSFIQMIAFERLTTLYAEYLGEKEIFLPSKDDYEPIKKELLVTLEKYKSEFGDAYHNAKSKLSNLNQVKRLSTTDKMFKIISDLNIPVTDDIQILIEQVRHKTIHRGELEKGNTGVANFYLLTDLLLEIILKLVDYTGPIETKIK